MRKFSWILGGVIMILALVASEAQAIDSVRAREIRGGEILLIVRGAEPFGVMTWEGEEIGTARRNGTFTARTFTPSNCIGEFSDGVMTLDVEVDRCMPTQALVERTGSTIDATPGEDGDIQAGVKFPEPRFTVNNPDGTITDNLTGLIWLQDANCPDDSRTWLKALDDVAELNEFGTMNNGEDCDNYTATFDDWRLPNVKELQSLVDYGQSSLALPDGHPFANVQPTYWSSTTANFFSVGAWFVDFVNGVVDFEFRDNSRGVVAVRGGL